MTKTNSINKILLISSTKCVKVKKKNKKQKQQHSVMMLLQILMKCNKTSMHKEAFTSQSAVLRAVESFSLLCI